MAEAVDPNLVNMATTNSNWISNGVKSGMDYAQAKAEMDQKRANIEAQREATAQQRALLNFQKQSMVVDDLKDVLNELPGPYRKAMQKKFMLKAQTIGLQVSPEFMAMLDDPEGQKVATDAVNNWTQLPDSQKASGAPALISAVGHDNAKKILEEYNNTSKNERESQKTAAETSHLAAETTAIPLKTQNEANKTANDAQKNAWENEYHKGLLLKQKKDNALKLSPIAQKFADPLRKMETTYETSTNMLQSALDNFRNNPSQPTKQQLVIAFARYGKETGRISNMEMQAYGMRTLTSDVAQAWRYMSSNPQQIDKPSFIALQKLAGDVLKRGSANKKQDLTNLFEKQINTNPELLNTPTGKHPIVQSFENTLGVKAVQDPSGVIKLVPNVAAAAAGPVIGPRESKILQAIDAGYGLQDINKALGTKRQRPTTDQEILQLKKARDSKKGAMNDQDPNADGRSPASAQDLMARNSELTQNAIGQANAAQISGDNTKPVEQPDDIGTIPPESQSKDISGDFQDLPSAPSRNPSSAEDDQAWLADAQDRAKKMGLELRPVTPVAEAKAAPDAAQSAPGQLQEANMDITDRLVPKEGKGKAPPRPFMTANVNGRQVVIPMINDYGRPMSEEQAIDQFLKTGEHAGVFEDAQSAEKYIGQYAKKDKKKGKK